MVEVLNLLERYLCIYYRENIYVIFSKFSKASSSEIRNNLMSDFTQCETTDMNKLDKSSDARMTPIKAGTVLAFYEMDLIILFFHM